MSTRRPRRVFGYARVSSEEQARGTSLADQQASIAAYAASRELKVTRYFVEAESAVHEKIERREQIRALLDEVRDGDLVLCDKLDRWSRDPEFTYGSVRKILAAGASFYAVSDRCDPSTSEGDTALGFRILFAREEHKRIKERMVGTRKLLRDRGYYVEGPPPYGYARARPRGFKGAEKNILVIVPERAEVVRRTFELAIAGSAMSTIAGELGITRDIANSILRTRLYIGEAKNSAGEWIRGMHPAIIDATTWQRAREAVAERRKIGARVKPEDARTSTWILRDVARCGLCGARMSAVYGRTREYYRCAHKCEGHRHVWVDEVEAKASEMIIDRLDELRLELAREPSAPPAPVVDFAEKRARLEAKRARYLEAFADGVMSRDELRAAVAKLDVERTKVAAAEAATRPKATRSRAEVLVHLKALKRAWRGDTPRDRRQIANALLVRVRLVYGEEPKPDWRPIEELLAVNASRMT